MITIRMNSKRLKLTVEGHALPEESSEYKQICSAASALAQSLAYCVSIYNGGKGTLKSFEYKDEPGDLLIRAWPEPWAELGIRQRFENYADGLELLAKSHPQSVTFIRDGEQILPEEENHE